MLLEAIAALEAPDTDTDTDPALDRFRSNRGEDALRVIMTEHAASLRIVARGVLRRHDLADDAVQETFMRLTRHADGIIGTAGPWLRRTVLNVALDLLRSEAARRRREHEFAENAASAVDASDGSLLDAEARRLVGEAISRLEEPLRSTVARVYFLGRTQEDVADEDGISQVAVHKRVRRALSWLRLELVRSGVADAVRVAVSGAPEAIGGRVAVIPEPACVLAYALWRLPELLRLATLAATRVGITGAALARSGI